MWVNWEEQLWSKTDHTTHGSSGGGGWGHKVSKPLAVKICGGCGSRRNSQPHRKVGWRDPQDPRTCTNTTAQEISTRRVQCACGVAKEVTESQRRAKQAALFPLNPSPTYSTTTQRLGLPHPGENLSLCPLQYNRCTQTKIYGPNERTSQTDLTKQIKTENRSKLQKKGN